MAYHMDSRGQLFGADRLAVIESEAAEKFEAMTAEQQAAATAGGVTRGDVIAKNVRGSKQDKSYGALVRQVLPTWMTGFFAAVMVGAILSSFNSALNATATLFSLGFYQRFFNPAADEQATVRSGRIFGTFIAVVAMFVAPMLAGQDSIFGYLQKMNGLYFIPIFAVVLLGMLDRRVPAWAANVALIVGFASIATGYFVLGDWMAAIKLHEFHFLGIVFVGLLCLMEFVAFMSPRQVAESAPEESLSPIPMTKWPLAVPAGVALAIAVLAIYGYFAI